MVKAWKEKVVIPTYEVGKPEKNPIFLEKRVYQGSSGVFILILSSSQCPMKRWIRNTMPSLLKMNISK